MHEFEFIKNKHIGFLYDLIIGFLSIIAIFIVVFQFNSNLTSNQATVLNLLDNIIYFLFLLDGIIKCFLAEDYKRFIIKNKIDYIALLPFQFFIYGNLGSIFKLLRVFTYFLRLIDNMKFFLFKTGFFQILLGTTLITLCGSIAIYFFEKSSEAVNSYGDALWLSLVTLTTVGYGDISPKTIPGRVISIILMITGIGFLSMVTSTISSYLISMKDSRDIFLNKESDKEFLDISDLSDEKKANLISYYNYLKEGK